MHMKQYLFPANLVLFLTAEDQTLQRNGYSVAFEAEDVLLTLSCLIHTA